MTGANDGAPTFEGHIKSLFRKRDRAMPYDTPWSTERVDLLERWVDSGAPR